MAAIDLVFIALIVIAAIRGYFRGFVREILSVAAPLLALLAGIFFSKPLGAALQPLIGNGGETANQIIAFLFLFIVVYLVVYLVQRVLHSILEKLNLENADRALGVLIGAAEGCVLVFLAIVVLLILPLGETHALVRGSFFLFLLSPFLPEIIEAGKSVTG